MCCVEDGNETPFAEAKHYVCLICAAKMRRIAMGAIPERV